MSKNDVIRILLNLEDERIRMLLTLKKYYGSKSEENGSEITLDVLNMLLKESDVLKNAAKMQDEEENDKYTVIRELHEELGKIPCKLCGKPRTPEGHDACLGELPGVVGACCGHGKEGYIEFENGTTIYGRFRSSND